MIVSNNLHCNSLCVDFELVVLYYVPGILCLIIGMGVYKLIHKFPLSSFSHSANIFKTILPCAKVWGLPFPLSQE